MPFSSIRSHHVVGFSGPRLRHDEMILVLALLYGPPMSDGLIEALRPMMSLLETFESRALFETLLTSAEPFPRLDAQNMVLLTKVLESEIRPTRAVVDAAVAGVRRSEWRLRRAELVRQIGDAERVGNDEMAMELTQKLSDAEKEVRQW